MSMKTSPTRTHTEAGFALLIALIVVGVVLSVGLTILDVSIKQVRLSTNTKDSEIAFHAANAGMECARYVRQQFAAEMETGQAITANCFGTTDPATVVDKSADNLDDAADAAAYLYTYDLTWGPADAERCTKVATFIASTSIAGDGATMTGLSTLLRGFPTADDNKLCEVGARCTVISVQGYNRPCGLVTNTPGTVQREVLLQF